MGYMKDRVLRDLAREDIRRIVDTFHGWQQGASYQDIPGFCRSTTLEEVRRQEHILVPGRYVGATAEEDDGEPFPERMERLVGCLADQVENSNRLTALVVGRLAELGYDI